MSTDQKPANADSHLNIGMSALFEVAITNYMDELSQKYKIPKEELVATWNKGASFKVDKDKVKSSRSGEKKTFEGTSCKAYLISGAKKGSICGQLCSVKSPSRMYCARHLKQEGKPPQEIKADPVITTTCSATVGKGDRKGQVCGIKVSAKSKTGKYCSRHCMKELEKMIDLPVGGKKEEKVVKKEEKKEDDAMQIDLQPAGKEKTQKRKKR